MKQHVTSSYPPYLLNYQHVSISSLFWISLWVTRPRTNPPGLHEPSRSRTPTHPIGRRTYRIHEGAAAAAAEVTDTVVAAAIATVATAAFTSSCGQVAQLCAINESRLSICFVRPPVAAVADSAASRQHFTSIINYFVIIWNTAD